MIETVETGRDAFRRHSWEEAVEAFSAAESAEMLAPADLELLADAYWWSGHPDDAVEAWERAFTGHLQSKNANAAAGVALQLAYVAMRRMAFSIGGGWIARAEELLEDEAESPVHAWLALMRAITALFGGAGLSEGVQRLEEALLTAMRQGNRDAESLARSFKGAALIGLGQWREGLKLVDQAASVAMSDEINLRWAADVYCTTIAACRDLADYGRAGEWTEEAERWMRRHAVGGYPGVCRVHRAELKELRGSWPEAEQEARQACDELQQYHLFDGIGFAQYVVGEVRLRMGDLSAAGEAFERAYQHGHSAQPGRALLLLARGDVDGAMNSITRSLSEEEGDPEAVGDFLARARLLPAEVEIALTAGDTTTAGQAVAEMDEIASRYDSEALRASAVTGRGALALDTGRAAEAVTLLDHGWRTWQQIGLPYESARARELLGKARAADGDADAATMDLRAAFAAFSELGAALDVRRVQETLGERAVTSAAVGARVTKTFMFTDIVTSTDLVGLIGDAAWEELLRWHDQELRTTFSRNHGEEVKHTGDGFFVAFERASDGIECAVAIQRGLAAHRRQHGFAPWVRIGLHTAEATRQGGDYSGGGVHVAARVGAIGEREEIYITSSVLESAGGVRFPLSEPRTVKLKGVTDPVELRLVAWRSL